MTDLQKMANIINSIGDITDTECLKTISDTARERRKNLVYVKTSAWRVGDEVKLLPEHQSRKPYDTLGKIIKINRVKMRVDFGNCMIYTVPKTMLMKKE